MRLFPNKSIQLYKDGFEEDDILQRKKAGKALTKLLNKIEEPLVVAIDGNWGTGKTWFLQRWIGDHISTSEIKSNVVYFDAFAHDYHSEPLPALVSALTNLDSGNNWNIRRLKKIAFKLAKPALHKLARVGTAVATSGASEVIGVGIKAIGDELETKIDKYWKSEDGKTAAIDQFKAALNELLEKNEINKIIFVIDELDRCRPDYALEMLEIIKHFFSVPNVHFVLGVNLKALEQMVRARYGYNNDAVTNDATIYLRKFIQVILKLPTDIENNDLDVNLYLEHLCEEMNLPNFISKQLSNQFKTVSQALGNIISLRDVENIVSLVNLSVNLTNDPILTDPKKPFDRRIEVMIDLIISKIVAPDLYGKFVNASISEQEIKKFFGVTDSLLGNNNTDPEHDDLHQYKTWMVISNNSFPKDFDQSIEYYRTTFGLKLDLNNINVGNKIQRNDLPAAIERKWLDPFKYYIP